MQEPAISALGAMPDPATMAYGSLTEDDLVNIVLQRSDVIADEPRPGEIIRAWENRDQTRLRDVVQRQGHRIALRAAELIAAEVAELLPVLDTMRPTSIADIGCGYGFFSLFLQARYGCDVLLIDIEDTEHRHFGFAEEGAAYADLKAARRFLIANGAAPDQVTTWNPEADPLDADTAPADLAVSFLACGFHFPVDMYMPFFRYCVADQGAILLDLRRRSVAASLTQLDTLGRVDEVSCSANRRRVIVRKGQT